MSFSGVSPTSQYVAERLHKAGAVIMALPIDSYTPTMLRHVNACMGGMAINRRNSAKIDDDDLHEAEQALCWLHFLPQDRPMLRHIVVARMQSGPHGDPLMSWNALGAILAADPKTVRRWHTIALDLIALALSKAA